MGLNTQSHDYDDDFFAYTSGQSGVAAARVTAIVCAVLPVRSVLDVGCAQGVWLAAWRDAGVADYVGIDGDYVDPRGLKIDAARFQARDLAEPIDLGRSFDLVQSLEVAEHLPADRADTFVASLVRHAPMVLFSAATPGQGGEHHVNEQPFEYWREKFGRHGYQPVDCVRPRIRGDRRIAPWYRYNTFLYVRRDAFAALPESVRQFAVADGQKLALVSPLPYRLRCALIARLPAPLVDAAARLKARALG